MKECLWFPVHELKISRKRSFNCVNKGFDFQYNSSMILAVHSDWCESDRTGKEDERGYEMGDGWEE